MVNLKPLLFSIDRAVYHWAEFLFLLSNLQFLHLSTSTLQHVKVMAHVRLLYMTKENQRS